MLLFAAFAYIRNYSISTQSTLALMLFIGVTIGSGARMLALWHKEACQFESVILMIIITLVLILTLDSLVNETIGVEFYVYQHYIRWNGSFSSPNTFGLLMGTGIVLTVALIVVGLKIKVGKFQKLTSLILCLFAVCLLFRGLLYSYSRGALLATICGFGYYIIQVQYKIFRGLKRSNVILIGLTIFLILISGFWQFEHTKILSLRRIFSVGNIDDFSWRNRIAAWEGSLQMMADRPYFGFGWNLSGPIYESYYCVAKVDESSAIVMNDHFTIGTELGIPALFCFFTYTWLSLMKNSVSSFDFWALNILLTGCRAGAVVLFFGFWFDGGLFDLTTAAPFWILLELGSA